MLHLALEDLFLPRWTEAIHEEWIRAVLAARPDLRREQLARTRNLMNTRWEDGMIVGYEELIPSLSLPDPADRHVLAAAVHCGADAIITFNLKHFPAAALEAHGIIAIHPDEFVGKLLDTAPLEVCAAATATTTVAQAPAVVQTRPAHPVPRWRADPRCVPCRSLSAQTPDSVSADPWATGVDRQLPGWDSNLLDRHNPMTDSKSLDNHRSRVRRGSSCGELTRDLACVRLTMKSTTGFTASGPSG